MIEIVKFQKEDMSLYGKTNNCKVYSFHVRVSDINSRANNMITMLNDKSWVSHLAPITQTAFLARAKETINKLVNDILEKVEDKVTEEFGEYLVSDVAQTTLKQQLSHIKLPLAELFKERISGNGGFDFHTESPQNLITFGEAKYGGKTNKYVAALTQIKKFISDDKDTKELIDLQHFVTDQAITNFSFPLKSYTAAFSINAKKPAQIIENALSHDEIDDLLQHSELFLIGVEIL